MPGRGVFPVFEELGAFLKDFNMNWGISVISIGNRGIFVIFPFFCGGVIALLADRDGRVLRRVNWA
jgi:hypothetical protein